MQLARRGRLGIAMIELIFAIVVMAIVLLSAPNLISQSTKSSYIGLQQESINAAASHLNLVLTKEWDEGNTDLTVDPRILQTGGNAGLNALVATGARAGTPRTSLRKYMTGVGVSPNASTTFGNTAEDTSDGNALDDVDDYHGNKVTLREVATSNKYGSDYKDKQITMQTSVIYLSDTPTQAAQGYANSATITLDNPFSISSAGSTNIKGVSVVLTTNSAEAELAKNITLSAFMCNIGHYALAPFRDVP